MGWARCPGNTPGCCFVDGGAGSRVPTQWLPCPCSTSPAEQPRVWWQRPQGESPLLVTSPSAPGGWQWQSHPPVAPGHVPACRQVKLGCAARPLPSTAPPPYLQDVACCFPGNGDGIPHTSGRVSLHPLRCQPCCPGNPASGSSACQLLGVPSCLLPCPGSTGLLWGPTVALGRLGTG